MDSKKTLLWITRTAVLIALLIASQWALGALTAKNQFVIGSAVNLILITAAVLSGLFSGICVAIVSPFMAFLLGIGTPFIAIVPFIALGNFVIVLVWHYVVKNNTQNISKMFIALVTGALLKFVVLYLSIVKFAIPVLLKLPEAKAVVISAAFNWPQLVTATIGGVIAILILPVIKKATSK